LKFALTPFSGFDRRIAVVVAANFVAVAARMSLVTFLGIYFVREAHIGLPLVGIAFLLENVSRGLLAPFFGALSDRVGRRPLLLASALGTAVVLPCFLLVSGPLSLRLPGGTPSGQVFTLRGRGLPRVNASGNGDLHVRVQLWTPTAVSAEQKKALEQLKAVESVPPESRPKDLWGWLKEALGA
jgi:hypothetical protein